MVVCLHSSGSASSQWRRLIESAQDRYRFVAFDFHGHGRSPVWTQGRYELKSEADAVMAALTTVGGPVHLVGHSYGGAVALDLAVRHPGRFASVCVYEPVLFGLLDPSSDDYRAITAVGLAIVRDARDGELDAASAAFIDFWNGAGAWDALGDEQRERVRARIVAVAGHFEAIFAEPLSLERLRGLAAPTLLLGGDRSPAPARAVAARLAGLPAVRAETLHGVGHMGPVTHAAIVNTRIVAHLDALAGLQAAA
jgi:pimeloyl-ACP methyl ester carboxylesterase